MARISEPSREAPGIWLGHTGEEGHEPVEWFVTAIERFIRAAGSARRPGPRPLADDRPLLGVPLVGIGRGGRAGDKGEVVEAVVSAAATAAALRDVDVTLVVREASEYSAVQQARTGLGHDLWGDISAPLRMRAADLGHRARSGGLVTFMGAGTGIGAGLPGWTDLLDRLARDAGMTGADRKAVGKLDSRDAAAVIERRLVSQGIDLCAAIEPLVTSSHVSLMHQLLASLPVNEAVTTNYDTLFEQAWRDAGHTSHVVLPDQSAQGAPAWLLKLHGSIGAGRAVVLSRDDYLRFEGEGVALAGIVQAMLLTRHMLFVGYSLSDDNFHRLVHQVRRAVGPADARPESKPFGTALAPGPPSLVSDLWAGDIDVVNVGGSSGPREVARLIDLIGAEAEGGSAHMVDDAYTSVLSADERALRAALLEVRSAAARPGVRSPFRVAVEDALDSLGSAARQTEPSGDRVG
ncbi:SIR2 family protein [Iamia sp. SCSIO 61187]|uniref:SIR2 family NAD-dependent protein deacylase n=1 Tax=Iamia sp. SCSIO 61187 TaxID=2722752 RepID=UPI001C634A0C|nr:SIR2 family protein [Iamia sp. SCSIO 61187]QYG95203.1 SIR2 family protein [Iamia sp. SCSIO 61187]